MISTMKFYQKKPTMINMILTQHRDIQTSKNTLLT